LSGIPLSFPSSLQINGNRIVVKIGGFYAAAHRPSVKIQGHCRSLAMAAGFPASTITTSIFSLISGSFLWK
jgi:hypothetical protein